MTLETHASLDRHLSIKDIARGIADDWNPSEEACAEAERIWATLEALPGFNERIAQGLEELDAGRRVEWVRDDPDVTVLG